MKKILIYAGVALSVFFLWLALKEVDFARVSQAFVSARLALVIPMLLCLAGFYWLKALRWATILSPRHAISSTKLAPSMMAGAAGNNLLPAHAGELVRVYFSASRFNVSNTTVLASLVVERLMDMLAVLLLFSIAILAGGYSTPMIAAGLLLLFFVIVVAIVCALIVNYTTQCVHFIRNKLKTPSEPIRNKAADQMMNLADGLSSLKEKNLYINVILNSLAQWMLMSACIYCSFLAFNIEASYFVAVIILGLIVVGLTLPTVPGFFGTIEYCFVLGLTTAGIDPSLAISAGIFYHIPAWVAVTFTGLVLAHLNHFSFSKLKADNSF